jgi:hypothetical protein
LNKKIKVKDILKQAVMVQRGSSGIALLFLQPWHWMRGRVVNATP